MTPQPDREWRSSEVAPFLFCSGACALIYQVVWLRQLRFIFGASTSASAAVLAVFMGGLGLGGLVIGKRVEGRARPLELYGNLELMVAASSAATPLLVWIARKAYYGLGGAAALGSGGATAARLVLAALVLGGPTVLMGGTMPAAAQAVSRAGDAGRRAVAVLYGVNTLGAVAGALLANFVLLEVFGVTLTLVMAALVNAVVGLVARMASRTEPSAASTSPEPTSTPAPEIAKIPERLSWFPPVAAGVAGFAFLLMELVWYRMLAPLLGGSSYTFGLILALALLGIGLGGALYAATSGRRPATIAGFTLTCAAEALFIALPYALGDRIAVLAILLRPLGSVGFYGHVAAWSVITSLVVLPAAIVSGYQFPLIIGLFGRGDERVARQVGVAYATNTLGAIGGSLAGGFGLLPALTAPGCWRAVVLGLSIAALGSAAISLRFEGRKIVPYASLLAALGAFVLVRSQGPTEAWRHSPIGAGREDRTGHGATMNSLTAWQHRQRAAIVWQLDGVESTVALRVSNGYAFVVNGKSDGDARTDAPTQVMGGLIGAALHPNPKSALVIGLGTGSTAGWLAAVPTMDRVDVVELEPAIVRVARACAPVNRQVLDDPKVHLAFGDAREALMVSRARYDVIFSEPSNPYRAGISSLYTEEFYQSVRQRLTEDGVFVQWLQAYEVDGKAIRTAVATLSATFPHVAIWETELSDLLLIGTQKPFQADAAALRARIEAEPYRTAMIATWRTADLEGFLAHHIASSALTRKIAQTEGDDLNTDDRNALEYAFARNVGKGDFQGMSELTALSRAMHADRPEVSGVDWAKVADRRVVVVGGSGKPPPEATAAQASLHFALGRYGLGDLPGALEMIQQHRREPATVLELELFAEALADAGAPEAPGHIERLRAFDATTAEVIRATWLGRTGKFEEAAAAFEGAFRAFRTDPWPRQEVMDRALDRVAVMFAGDRVLGRRMFEALHEPFAVDALRAHRRAVARQIAETSDARGLCVEALTPDEPHPVWELGSLTRRYGCYQVNHHPLAAAAKQDLERFVEGMPAEIGAGLQ
jgi:predicted membrane-bound spermidine synthase